MSGWAGECSIRILLLSLILPPSPPQVILSARHVTSATQKGVSGKSPHSSCESISNLCRSGPASLHSEEAFSLHVAVGMLLL